MEPQKKHEAVVHYTAPHCDISNGLLPVTFYAQRRCLAYAPSIFSFEGAAQASFLWRQSLGRNNNAKIPVHRRRALRLSAIIANSLVLVKGRPHSRSQGGNGRNPCH